MYVEVWLLSPECILAIKHIYQFEVTHKTKQQNCLQVPIQAHTVGLCTYTPKKWEESSRILRTWINNK